MVHLSWLAIKRKHLSAKQTMVNDGFTPRAHGIIEESTTYSPS